MAPVAAMVAAPFAVRGAILDVAGVIRTRIVRPRIVRTRAIHHRWADVRGRIAVARGRGVVAVAVVAVVVVRTAGLRGDARTHDRAEHTAYDAAVTAARVVADGGADAAAHQRAQHLVAGGSLRGQRGDAEG